MPPKKFWLSVRLPTSTGSFGFSRRQLYIACHAYDSMGYTPSRVATACHATANGCGIRVATGWSGANT